MNAAADAYHARFRKVLDYIDAHLGEPLSLDRLSHVAAFSKFHFHRQFSAMFGVGVYRYVQLRRLKRASFQLAFRSQLSILDIALTSGYDGPEAFARAFRKNLGLAPSEFRKNPEWDAWHAAYSAISTLRTVHMNPVYDASQVRIIQFTETPVAAMEHRGDPDRILHSVQRFIEWRKRNNLPPKLSATFNILYDDPSGTAPEDFRLDLCASTESLGADVTDHALGVVARRIPGGRCAVLRHIGSEDTLPGALEYLYAQWLPDSGEALRDFPAFLQRVRFFPDVPEHEAITDVFLPLR